MRGTGQKSDYNTWFINNGDRLKAFRSVRQGVRQVVEDIEHARPSPRGRGKGIAVPPAPDIKADGDVLGTIQMIDVLWFEKGGSRIVCPFEVGKSTSIYSGILGLSDLTLSIPGNGHDESLCRFGENHGIMAKIARKPFQIGSG